MPEPLYDLQDVKALIAADSWEYGTERCRLKVRDMGLSRANVATILTALVAQDHRSIFGSCGTDWGEVQADDYVIWFDEDKQCRCARFRGLEIYIKLAVHADADGQFMILIRFHPST